MTAGQHSEQQAAGDALERILREELPTGMVLDWSRYRQPVTPEEAAENRAALEAAIRPQRRREAA